MNHFLRVTGLVFWVVMIAGAIGSLMLRLGWIA